MIPLSLPEFPKFKKLSIEDQEMLNRFTSQFLPFSDFNFISMWSYGVEGDIKVSSLNDNLVVRFRDYISDEPFYSFIGTNAVLDTVLRLMKFSESEGVEKKFKLIPSVVLDTEPRLSDIYEVAKERDDFDYILSARELMELSGNKYATHRKLVHRFHRRVVKHRINDLDLSDENVCQQVLKVFMLWEEKKSKDRSETEIELAAINRLMRYSSKFKLMNLGIFDDEELIGFLIADRVHPRYAQVHFAKSDPSYSQLYYVMLNNLGKRLCDTKHNLVNIEQDLGIPGLRSAKEKWNPVEYLEKYIISEKKE